MNGGYIYRARVEPSEADALLVPWLARRYAHSDEAVWRARVEAGEVDVGGALATVDLVLRRGQEVVWRRPPWEEPPVPLRMGVCWEDDDLLIVDKPSGLPTLPAGGFLDHTLLALVAARRPGAAPLHRLGRGTSGLVLCGVSPEARSALQRDLRGGAIKKTYLALAQGAPAWDGFVIDAPIGPMPHPRLGTVFAATGAGRPARSVATVVQQRAGEALVEVVIPTGRPHQIRAHLASAGHPLVGDPLYGPDGLPRADALPGDLGYHLHAWRLELVHPTTGAAMVVQAPIPAGSPLAR